VTGTPADADAAKPQERSSRNTELIKFNDGASVVCIDDAQCASLYRVLDPAENLIGDFATLADLRTFLDSRPDLASLVVP
jgi:hypothetical protein